MSADAEHRDGRRFRTPGAPAIASWGAVFKLWLRAGTGADAAVSPRGHWPRWIEIAPRALPPQPPRGSHDIVTTWINHSSFLAQTASVNLLFDPVFSRCCGPFGRFGPSRVHAPGDALDALPRIDAVLLSHDHYDHCDLQSLRRIVRRAPAGNPPLGITPLGNGALLRRAGFAPERIVELDWWRTHEIRADAPPALRVTLTPSQHWSKRLSSGRNSRLWGGFFLRTAAGADAAVSGVTTQVEQSTPQSSRAAGSPDVFGTSLYFAGDTGYHENFFHDIAARLGAPDLALLPIGAYEPRWFMRPQHCNPAEAVRIHRDLGSRLSVAMHWGTFRLTDEARDEPPRALAAALDAAGLPSDAFRVLEPGESVAVSGSH